MHPALSVIFFTTLSGAGYGLLAWLGASLALAGLRGDAASPALVGMQLAALLLGLALSTIGLLASLAHLGKPQRAWRAFSQWRTSWLSREGLMSMLTLLPALALGALLWRGASPQLLAVPGVVLALCALATVACTAMIYASLKPIPAWRHPLVVPVYLLFALLTGLALLFALVLAMSGGRGAIAMLASLAAAAALLVALKWRYWFETDRAGLPTRGAAIGLPGRAAAVFERPHTEANYVTREMAFEVARAHARRLRIGASALVLGGPVLACLGLVAGVAGPVGAMALAAVLMLAGAFVERWLFFAQARHVVTSYY
ncbi:MAG TPA: DmsC/YnfH family molybdoenzyme membrane anchor subunit [Luteimonas sp.]|nr:DmsC/YnfH family molybdoenzyme membrane anchor subunit [Luteimonas sp.]